MSKYLINLWTWISKRKNYISNTLLLHLLMLETNLYLFKTFYTLHSRTRYWKFSVYISLIFHKVKRKFVESLWNNFHWIDSHPTLWAMRLLIRWWRWGYRLHSETLHTATRHSFTLRRHSADWACVMRSALSLEWEQLRDRFESAFRNPNVYFMLFFISIFQMLKNENSVTLFSNIKHNNLFS
jgi:hypothetical protein